MTDFLNVLALLSNFAIVPGLAYGSQLALGALLVRVAFADRNYRASEIGQIDQILARTFGLKPIEAAKLRATCEALERDAPGTPEFTRILREEVEELARLGAVYIQIDAPHYPLLLDPETRAFYESRGWTLEKWLNLGIELDNAVMGDIPDVTFGFHLCRGNQKSRWLVEGGYEAIAEPIFRGIRAHRLLLEYDDARSGSFAPLAYVPDDRMVVLGLVSTKRPALEEPEFLTRRIDEAARYVDKDRLALSPQCGFSTSIIGNELSIEDEKAKLRLVTETARRVWG